MVCSYFNSLDNVVRLIERLQIVFLCGASKEQSLPSLFQSYINSLEDSQTLVIRSKRVSSEPPFLNQFLSILKVKIKNSVVPLASATLPA